MRSRSSILAACVLALAACGDDGTGTEAGETGDDDGGANPPGPADGWESAFDAAGVVFECGDPEADIIAAGAPSVSFGDTTLYVGIFENNQAEQDAIFARFDAGTEVYCVHHEMDGPNGRALGLTWDGGATAYVVYVTFAAGSGFSNLGGWLPEYSPGPISGVGEEVAIVGSVSVDAGTLDAATFVIAVTADEQVAAHVPLSSPTVLEDGSVEMLGSCEEAPIDADAQSAMSCEAGPHATQYVFSGDLSSLVCASGSGCTSMSPC